MPDTKRNAPFEFDDDMNLINDFAGVDTETGQPYNVGEGKPGEPFAGTVHGRRRNDGHNIYQEATLSSFEPGATTPGGLFASGADGLVEEGAEADSSLLFSSISDENLQAMCKERVCPACSVYKEAADIKLRSLAEVDNARKRMTKEKEDFSRFAAESVLSDIIPSIDNLELALQHAGSDAACKNLAIGVDMTKKLLLDSLQKHGLTQVGKVGEAFDPALHEAMGTEDVADVAQDHVTRLIVCGYKLHDRLIRPAKVMVCKKG